MLPENYKVLITGVPGQVGNELFQTLGEENAFQLTREHCDLADQKMTLKRIGQIKPDLVVHSAGTTAWKNGDDSLSIGDLERLHRSNAVATDNVVKACALSGSPLLYLSCDAVLSHTWNPSGEYDETTIPCAVGAYAASKLAAESAILRIAQFTAPEIWNNGFKYWIIRTSSLYESTWRRGNNIVTKLLEGAARKESTKHIPNNFMFSPTYVPHFVKSLVHVMQNLYRLPSGIFHLRSEGSCTPFEFAMKLRAGIRKVPRFLPASPAVSGSLSAHNTIFYPRRVLAMGKIKRFLPDLKIPTWEDGLEDYCQIAKKSDALAIS